MAATTRNVALAAGRVQHRELFRQNAALASGLAHQTTPSPQRRTFATSPTASLPVNPFSPPTVQNNGGRNLPSSYFQRPSLPANTVVRFVPQQTAWIVERMGKFHRILKPGLAVLLPLLDRIAYVKSLKESAIEIPSQSAITADNVTLELDGVLYTRIFDAYKARSVMIPSSMEPHINTSPATASKTQNTPSANSPKPRCARRSASSPSTTSCASAPA